MLDRAKWLKFWLKPFAQSEQGASLAPQPDSVVFVLDDNSECRFEFDDESIHSKSRKKKRIQQGEAGSFEISILEAALACEIEISHSCGGQGTCSTCRVFIEHGSKHLEPRGVIEREVAEERGFEKNERLACQTFIVPNLRVRVPPV